MNASTAARVDAPATHRVRAWLWLLGVIGVALALRWPTLALPLERDEGAYAYVAANWLRGALPYRDTFDHKPPLIHLLYMPALLFGPPSAFAIRLWATCLWAINVGLVYSIGRRVWDRATGLLAALMFGVAGSAWYLQGAVLNTDQAMVLPALLALLATLRLHEHGRLRFAYAAGAAVAASVLIKPVAIVLAPCVLLAIPWSARKWAQSVGVALLGALSVALPIAAYFAANNAVGALVQSVWTYNLVYAGESRARWELGALVDMFAPFVPLLLLAIGGGVQLWRKHLPQSPRSRVLLHSGWIVAAWGVALLAGAIGSLRAFVHYYYPTLPMLALLAAPAITRLWRHSTRADRVTALLLCALAIGPFVAANVQMINAPPEAQATRLYGRDGQFFFAPAAAAAKFVQERTQPTDYVHIFGAEPQIYLLAERRAASRYIFDYPIGLIPGAKAELLHDLQQRPPKLLITYAGVRPSEFVQTQTALGFGKIAEIGGYEIWGGAR